MTQSSLTDLPFEDGAFDLVTSFDVICGIDDYGPAFRAVSYTHLTLPTILLV